MRLIASYHGIYDQETFNDQLELFTDLYKRVSFPIANGGLALRCIDSVYLTAFVCSMAASSTHLSDHFPEWIQTSIVDNVHKITPINENISLYTNDQIMYCAQKIQSKVPNGYLEGLNFPAPSEGLHFLDTSPIPPFRICFLLIASHWYWVV